MNEVRIDVHAPGEARWSEDLVQLLREQPGRDAAWAARTASALAGGPPGAFDVFVRAAAGGVLAGGALLVTRREAGDPGERPCLLALWVRPEIRGRGLGRRLTELAGETARARGAAEITAWASPEDDASLFLGERWGWFRERVLLSRAL